MELDFVEDAKGGGIVDGASRASLSRDLAECAALVCDVFPTLAIDP